MKGPCSNKAGSGLQTSLGDLEVPAGYEIWHFSSGLHKLKSLPLLGKHLLSKFRRGKHVLALHSLSPAQLLVSMQFSSTGTLINLIFFSKN